jgi:hypothetical protein
MSYIANRRDEGEFERGGCGQASRLIEWWYMLFHSRHRKSPFCVQIK